MTTEPELNPVINTTTRLTVMAVLAAVEEMEFGATRDAAGISDSVLSKQATALERAGYLTVRKGSIGRRPRTWLSLTTGGRTAIRNHIAALRHLLARAEAPPQPTAGAAGAAQPTAGAAQPTAGAAGAAQPTAGAAEAAQPAAGAAEAAQPAAGAAGAAQPAATG
ncbi:transcriptional regulator [Actinoplanes sp. DH11]|uniref:winged helix-turn-helix domain-containing protein n=1 Tax=Actinoplanes sp. DH11 TaxID=2857011 RepID=UPI001E6571F7|nr:transcriptional regulator [Actinoplanes sp. DH11]